MGGGGDSENDKLFNDLYQLDTGYFTTDEKQISKLIYLKNRENKDSERKPMKIEEKEEEKKSREPYTMNKSSYEYNNGQFSQSNFNNHVQHFMQTHPQIINEQNPLMEAGVISDDITNVSQEIDAIIQSVENSIKSKINEFRQKEQGYIMILRSIEAERSKLIDDVNRDVTMLKFSVKESLDKLQQKFIAKMLRKHVDYVNNKIPPNYDQQQITSQFQDNFMITNKQKLQNEKKSKTKTKSLVRSPLIEPSLGTIQDEPQNKDIKKEQNGSKKEEILNQEIKEEHKENEKKINKKEKEINNDDTKESAENTNISQIIKPQKINTKQLQTNNNSKSPITHSPQPQNSQSPNPTQSTLQQQQMGQIGKVQNSLIGNTLIQQAEFQKHQMMARHFVKQQEVQRQQKLQQIARQAQQIYNHQISANNTQQTQTNNNQSNSWWQRGANNPYSIASYNYNQ